MAVVNLYGTKLDAYYDPTTPPGAKIDGAAQGGKVRVYTDTVEVGSADSATSTYFLARIPSNARILGASKLYWDDLASAGAPTLDIGLFAVNSNITSDADALNDGLDAAAAGTGTSVVKNIANYGKMAWEYVSGQSVDPGGMLDVKVTLADADVNVGGTITMELFTSQNG